MSASILVDVQWQLQCIMQAQWLERVADDFEPMIGRFMAKTYDSDF